MTPADATSGADAAPAPQPGRFTAFRRWLLEAVLDWKFEAAVTVLILANTAFLSMEYHGMPEVGTPTPCPFAAIQSGLC